MIIQKIIISSIILFLLDFIYLYFNQKWYKGEILRSQGSSLKLKWSGVFLRYFFQILGLNLFILNNNLSPLYAFLYGIIIYGNYIGTNYATISIFDPTLAVVDLIKGGILMYLTTFLTYKILKIN